MCENELTLMMLRRLSRTVMNKNERYRFEARKLCRSNIVKFLESHLTHASDKVRYLALELFCCTIPRLTNKTDCFLRPLLPKVFQCLQRDEAKDTKLKALHFLRGFFRHTKSLSGFIDNFVELGIKNPDPDVQISCCLGLSIVFDQDIGNNLFSHLVVSVANMLARPSSYGMARAAYRALRHIHKTVGDERFYYIMHPAYEEARDIYIDLVTFDEMDAFLSTSSSDCSTLLNEYQMKRKYLNFDKDFGILDHSLIDQIQRTKNCERAKALGNLLIAVKRSSWTEADIDQHILDFFKVIRGFTEDSNRLIQMCGLDILKEVINKLGFILSPHIYSVVEILQNAMMSANSKIRCKVNRVLHKLMNNTHPMTVMWYMLNTKNSCIKEAVLLLVQEKISYFPYYEMDMVPLCNYVGQYLEDKNPQLAKSSRDCMILLLDIMRGCPVYGIRTEALRVLLRNYKLSRETLKDIGVIGTMGDEDYTDYFESESGEETTDMDTMSIPTATSVSLISTPRSISTAGESETKRIDEHEETILVDSHKRDCEESSSPNINKTKSTENGPPVKQENRNAEFQLHSQSSIRGQRNWQKNFPGKGFTDKTLQNIFTEYPNIKQTLARKVETTSETTLQDFGDEKDANESFRREEVRSVSPKSIENEGTNQDFVDDGPVGSSTDSEKVINPECLQQKDDTADSECKAEDKISGKQRRKYFTPFCLKNDSNSYTPNSRIESIQAGGDCEILPDFDHLDFQKDSACDIDRRYIKETYEQDGIQVDVLNKDVFNFNIQLVENSGDEDCADETDDFEITEYKEPKIDSASNQVRINHEKKYFSTNIATETRNFIRDKKLNTQQSVTVRKNTHASLKECHKHSENHIDTNTKTAKSKFLMQLKKDHTSITAETVNDTALNAFTTVSKIQNCNYSPINHSIEKPKSPASKDNPRVPFIHYSEEKKILCQKDKQCNRILNPAEDSCSSSLIYLTEERSSPEAEDEYISQVDNSSEVLSSPYQTEGSTVFYSPDVSNLQVTKDSYCTPIGHSQYKPNNGSPKNINRTRIIHTFSELSSPDQTEGPTVFHSPDVSNLQVTKDSYCTPISHSQDESNNDAPKNINRTRIIHSLEQRKNPVQEELSSPIIYSPTECETSDFYDQNTSNNSDSHPPETAGCNSELSFSRQDFDKNETPFLPKSRQLTRTPVEIKNEYSLEVQQKTKKSTKSSAVARKKVVNDKKKNISLSESNQVDETASNIQVGTPSIKETNVKLSENPKYNSPSKWNGCQWRRDLEYASKAAPCLWADIFEDVVKFMKPFETPEEAENEMKRAIDNLYGKSWQEKEEAMLVVIRLAKHHPETVNENASKIIVSLSNEIRNIRQSVAGKAILTAGFLYEIMGKAFENKMRLVVAALLAKSGNRTLAAYFRLVIKSLRKIINSTTPQKAAAAFIQEGSRHPNKAARETAAQFIAILTRTMGPENSLVPHNSSQMLKCAANFVFDSSALTRYCGMCMFEVLMKHPEFEKMKDHQLDINMFQNLSKILKKIKAKGINEETFPISIID